MCQYDNMETVCIFTSKIKLGLSSRNMFTTVFLGKQVWVERNKNYDPLFGFFFHIKNSKHRK